MEPTQTKVTQMTKEITTDKRKESIVALKQANKHLAEIFNKLDEMERVIASVASDLTTQAGKMGDIQTIVWYDGQWRPQPMKETLKNLAQKLEKARL